MLEDNTVFSEKLWSKMFFELNPATSSAQKLCCKHQEFLQSKLLMELQAMGTRSNTG